MLISISSLWIDDITTVYDAFILIRIILGKGHHKSNMNVMKTGEQCSETLKNVVIIITD